MKYSDKNKPLVCMMTQSTCYKGTRKFTPKGVLWHSTGANNPWLKRYVQPDDNAADRTEWLTRLGKNAYNNDWNHIDRQAGLNFWIGKLADGTVAAVQTMPWGYRPWGCGSGSKGSGNDLYLQFEICEDNLNDKSYWEAVYKEACEMTAYLCKMFNINPKGTISYNGLTVPTIIDHTGSHALGIGSNHGDVQHWSRKYGVTMETVRNDVAAILAGDGSAVTVPVADNSLKKGSTGDAVKTMQAMLIACGYSCGASGADGDFGKKTEAAVKAFQKDKGLTVDGVYGEQTKAALEKAYANRDTTTPTGAGETAAQLRARIVSRAISFLGCNEADGSHKKIIDLYNSQNPLPVGYKVTYSDAWCDAFASAVAVAEKLTDIIPTECGCDRHIALFKKIGRWVEDDAYVPSPGDYIFYDWQDSGSGDNTGSSDHVGIVVSVSGSSIKVIEGNKSDAVGYRNISVNGRYIRGYGVPDYESKAKTPAETTVPETTDEAKLIWDRLYASIQNPYGVAGVLANFMAESSLKSTNLQDSFEKKLSMTDEQYTAAVDDGAYTNFVHDSSGYGLYQATFWSIKESLLNFAKGKGVSIGDRDMQVDHFLKLMKEEYTGIWKVLTTAKNVREASDAVLLKFERPADQSEAVQERRAAYGEQFYEKYAGSVATPSTPAQETKPYYYRVRRSWADKSSQIAACVILQNAKNIADLNPGYKVFDEDGKCVYGETVEEQQTFTPYRVRVSISDLRIRKGPGTDYDWTGEYTGKGVFTAVAESSGKGSDKGWMKLKSGAGWISLDYCEKL